MNKKISIIIPVYNTEKYIERCIKSVLKQTYENIEIICVDDGSTDKSGIILDRLGNQDNRLIVIHKTNEGVTEARNAALEHASGEYIGFVDSDDYIDENMYEELVRVIEKNDVDIAACSYYIACDTNVSEVVNCKPVPEGIQKIEDFLIYIYERDVYRGVAGYLWTRLFKSSLIKNGEGNLLVPFKKEFLGADDIVFIADINMRCKTIRYIDKPLYYYYQRDGSIVHDERKQLNELFWIKAYEYIIDRYSNAGERVLDIVKRMYVFRCGKLMEYAIQVDELEKAAVLRKKIKRYLDVYVRTNIDTFDRVKWIVDIIVQSEKLAH